MPEKIGGMTPYCPTLGDGPAYCAIPETGINLDKKFKYRCFKVDLLKT